MADILIDIGLDLTKINADIKKAAVTIQQEFSKIKPKLNVDGTVAQTSINKLASSFNSLSKQAGLTTTQMKQAMAQMILQGQKGTAEYNAMEKELKEVTAQSKLLASALDTVDKELDDVGKTDGFEKAKKSAGGFASTLKDIGKTAISFAGGSMIAGGIGSLVGGFKDIVDAGKTAYQRMEQLKIAFTTAGLSGNKLDEALKKSSKTASELSMRFGVSAGAIREVQKDVALLGGITGKTNDVITEAAVGIEKLTNGEIDASSVIRAFTKGGEEGAEGLGRLTMKFPGLAAQLKGIRDPGEKARAAIKALQGGFEELEKSPLTAIDRAKVAFNSIKSTIGTNIIEVLAPIGEVMATVAQTVVGAIKGIISVIKDFKPIFISLGVIAAGIAVSMNAAAIATLAYTAVQKAAALATTIWTTAQKLLNLTMAANPIGLIVAGVVLLTGVIITLAEKVGGFDVLLEMLWATIKIGWEYIKALGETLIIYFTTPFRVAYDTITAFVKGVAKVWEAIKNLDFKGAIDAVTNTGKEMGKAAVGAVTNSVGDIKNAWVEAGEASSEIWKELDKGTASTKEITEANAKYAKEVQTVADGLRAVTNEYDAQIDAVKKLQEGFKAQFDGDVEAYKAIMKIKNLSDTQYIKYLALLKTEAARKEANDARFMDDKAVAAYKKRADMQLDILRKQKRTEENIDKEFSLEQEKDKPKAATKTNKEQEKDKDRLAKLKEELTTLQTLGRDLIRGTQEYKDNIDKAFDVNRTIQLLEENIAKFDEALKIKAGWELSDITQTKFEELTGKKQLTMPVNIDVDYSALQIDYDKLETASNYDEAIGNLIKDATEATTKLLSDSITELFNMESEAAAQQTELLASEYDKQTDDFKAKLSAQEIGYDEYRKNQAKADEEYAAQLAKVEEETQSTWEKIGQATLEAGFALLEKQVPIWVASIVGNELATKGFLGLATSAVLTAALMGLVGVARSSLGAEDGVVGLTNGYNKAPKGKDSIPFLLAPMESVINAKGTQANGNAEFFNWVNRTGGSINDYMGGVVVNELKGIKQELRSAKLVESYNNNSIIIEDNRSVKIKSNKWSGR